VRRKNYLIPFKFRPVPEKYGFLAVMPVALKDQTTEDIFDGTNSKEARKVYA
jgi:hypothetical protein